MFTHRLASIAALLALTAAISNAQSVVSAHSGTLHYFDGVVTIDGAKVESKVGKFSEIKDNSVLATEQGRAEVLLTPGVFLRLGENTQIRMLDNRLMSTRVEVLSGSAMVESDDAQASVKNPAVTILYKHVEIQPVKFGVFEITSSPSQLRVFKGEATAIAGNNRATIKEGRLMPFSAGLTTEKFDEKQADDLYLWARDRSAYLSAANMSSAKSLSSSGFASSAACGGGPSGLGFNRYGGNWYYNNPLGMYTYVPCNGTSWGPFGYGYFSPFTIYGYYYPGNYYWYGGGGSRAGSSSGVPLTNIGTSSLAAAQISRNGAGLNTHPTLSSPVRSGSGVSSPTNASAAGYRGGFQNAGSSNPGFSSVGSSSGFSGGSSGGGFSSAASSGSGAGVSAGGGGHVGGGGGGGSRGK